MRLAGSHGALSRTLTASKVKVSNHLRILPSTHRFAHQLVPQIELRNDPNPEAKKIAVLGGGLTGLATAYQLARTIPHAKIALFEKEDRVGGWVDSEVVQVDDGEVLFEWGPRSIRPDPSGAGLATLALLIQLGIHDKVIGIGKKSPAATNRFVYYPDHLVRMPGPFPSGGFIGNIVKNIYTILSEPIYNGVLSGLIAEPAVRTRSPQVADEALGAFLRRRFGRALTDNLASAVIHGIYAGDIHDLSARTLMPSLWYAETRDSDGNGVIAEFADLAFKKQYLRSYSDVYFQNLVVGAKDVPRGNPMVDAFVNSIGRDVSVYTFSQGTGLIAKTLCKALEKNDNVTIHTSTPVDRLTYESDTKQIKLLPANSPESESYDYVVSTLSPAHLKQQLSGIQRHGQSNLDSSALVQQLDRANESVDVMVVNLYYSNPSLLAAEGFGYLIPQSIPTEQNPERALGVIFGSETSGLRGPEAVQDVAKFTTKELKEIETDMDQLEKQLEIQASDDPGRASAEAALKMIKLTHARALEDVQNPEQKQVRLGQDTAPGTKLTVMMGGHWWKTWAETDLPSEEEAIEMAKAVLARHLNITEAPTAAKARLNRKCIPQYRPGYRQSMAAIHNEVLQDFHGRLKLAGTYWQGAVGVNDCIRKARLTAFSIREQWDEKTGLEDYSKTERYVIVDGRTNQVVMDPLQS